MPTGPLALVLISSAVFLQLPAQAGIDLQIGPDKTISTGKASPPQQSALKLGMFGSMEIQASGLPGQKKWQDLSQRLVKEQRRLDKCIINPSDCERPIERWLSALKEYRLLSPIAQLQAVNNYAHRVADYTSDAINYGSGDHWATPVEFLRGVGDCEDFAIFKYQSLLRLGHSPQDVRMVIVKDDKRKLYHAVVSVHVAGRTFVLDSLSNEVLTDDQLLKYRPLRSYSGANSYMHIVTDAFRLQYLAELASRLKLPRHLVEDKPPVDVEQIEQSLLYMCRGCGSIKPNILGLVSLG